MKRLLSICLLALLIIMAIAPDVDAQTVTVHRSHYWNDPYWRSHRYGYWHDRYGYWRYRSGSHVFIRIR